MLEQGRMISHCKNFLSHSVVRCESRYDAIANESPPSVGKAAGGSCENQ